MRCDQVPPQAGPAVVAGLFADAAGRLEGPDRVVRLADRQDPRHPSFRASESMAATARTARPRRRAEGRIPYPRCPASGTAGWFSCRTEIPPSTRPSSMIQGAVPVRDQAADPGVEPGGGRDVVVR